MTALTNQPGVRISPKQGSEPTYAEPVYPKALGPLEFESKTIVVGVIGEKAVTREQLSFPFREAQERSVQLTLHVTRNEERSRLRVVEHHLCLVAQVDRTCREEWLLHDSLERSRRDWRTRSLGKGALEQHLRHGELGHSANQATQLKPIPACQKKKDRRYSELALNSQGCWDQGRH